MYECCESPAMTNDSSNPQPAQAISTEIEGLTRFQFSIRVIWAGIRIVAAFWCMRQGELFFYQGF